MEIINESFCKKVNELVLETGEFIRRESLHFSLDRVEKKGKNDLVSYVDKEAERKLVRGLSDLIPESGFITEEGTIHKTGDRYNWIIDPLDGTTNFIHGLPVYSISIALQEYDELVLGVVYDIPQNELFYSWKNGGVFMNQNEILVSTVPLLSSSLIATGFPYTDFDMVDPYLSLLKGMMQDSQGIRRLGSAAIDMAYVACGRFEGYFEFNINSWDIAGGTFLVRQAGGRVTNFHGKSDIFTTRQMVATNGKIHQELLDHILVYFPAK